MKLSNMFKKTSRRGYISLGEGKPAHMAPEVPEGLLKKCNVCKSAILTEDVKNGYYICPKCQNYFRVHAMHRIEMVADAGTFEEWDKGLAIRQKRWHSTLLQCFSICWKRYVITMIM